MYQTDRDAAVSSNPASASGPMPAGRQAPAGTDAMPVEDAVENCRHCLMCRHMCPVGHVTHRETLTPHGWGQLVASERRGLLAWDAPSIDALYSCADCGSCRSHCLTSQPLPDQLAAVRADLAAQGQAPAAVYEVAERLAAWGTPYAEVAPLPPKGRGEMALFVGDEARHLRPAALEAALDLLAAVDIRPVLMGRGRSSGFLASSLGLPRMAKDLALANVNELGEIGTHRLLVLSPGDYYAFNRIYPERLGLTLPAGIEVQELVPFLAGQVAQGALHLQPCEMDGVVAYIDPAHAVRLDARHEAPRQLLRALLGRPAGELFWRRERAHPGGHVALQFTHPALADRLTQARLHDAARTGAAAVVSEDPGGLHHLDAHAAAFGLQVHGLYELLASHLA